MRELLLITEAFESLKADGKPAALATVVNVEGSAYRRPGARMLIAEDGRTWGGVSGGCLERDVVRRGISAIDTGKTTVVRYDTSDDEQLSGGVATGCGGTIEVLIQPITAEQAGALPLLADVLSTRQSRMVATLVRTPSKFEASRGMSLARYAGRGQGEGFVAAGGVRAIEQNPHPNPLPAYREREQEQSLADAADAAFAMWAGSSRLISVETSHGPFSFLVEQIQPPQRLVIFGAGPDVVPVVDIAKTLGWHVTVVATRPATHAAARFASADAVCVTGADEPVAGVEISSDSAVVLMTHNVARDARILLGLPGRPRYLGILGPRHRTQKLLRDVPAIDPEPVYSPVGLDLGAETPEEIALAIVAEIQAALRDASSGSLRDSPGPIHADSPRADPRTDDKQSPPGRTVSCPL